MREQAVKMRLPALSWTPAAHSPPLCRAARPSFPLHAMGMKIPPDFSAAYFSVTTPRAAKAARGPQ